MLRQPRIPLSTHPVCSPISAALVIPPRPAAAARGDTRSEGTCIAFRRRLLVGRTYLGRAPRRAVFVALLALDLHWARARKAGEAGLRSRPLVQGLMRLADVWGDDFFISRGGHAQQNQVPIKSILLTMKSANGMRPLCGLAEGHPAAQVTWLLNKLLLHVGNPAEFDASGLVPPVSKAIQARLHSPVPDARVRATRTAEVFSVPAPPLPTRTEPSLFGPASDSAKSRVSLRLGVAGASSKDGGQARGAAGV